MRIHDTVIKNSSDITKIHVDVIIVSVKKSYSIVVCFKILKLFIM